MDDKNVKAEIIEKIDVDKAIDEQLEWKDPDTLSQLDERDKEAIKRKLRAEMELQLCERLDREIEEQLERKKQEQERIDQLKKSIRRVCSAVTAGVALCCAVAAAIRIAKAFSRKKHL